MDLSNIKLPRTMDTFGKWVVGLAVGFVSYTVNEIRTDVKQLMTQSNINTTKIEGLEARVKNLEQVTIFDRLDKKASSNKTKPELQRLVFIKNDDEELRKWTARL